MSLASWPDSAPDLIDVAAGRKPAEMVVRNGRWVNVHSGEIIAGMDVAIIAGRFAAIAPDLAYAIGPETRVSSSSSSNSGCRIKKLAAHGLAASMRLTRIRAMGYSSSKLK